MKRFRQALIESQVGAITVAMLLLWFLVSTFEALWTPMYRVLRYLFTAVAILDIPYITPGITYEDRSTLMFVFLYGYAAIINILASWLISRWLFETGPIRGLTAHWSHLIGRHNV